MKSNFKKFILLWFGELISSVGGGLTSFGLGVYIFQKTGSASSMALITLLGFIPTLLLSVPAGVLADKYDRRLLMILGDGLSAFGVVFILICMLNGGASLFQICVVAYAISGVLADSIGNIVGSVGRGAAVVIEISGLLLFVISILIPKFKSLKDIEVK